MKNFSDKAVRMDLLKERAFNLRWATLPKGVIALTAADPDFPIAPSIRTAIQDYTEGGVFSYGPAEGLPSFRKTVARIFEQRRGVKSHSDQILPCNSAAYAMFLVAKYCLQPGDEAIIFDPVDFLFKKSVESAGAKAIYCPVDRATGAFDQKQLKKLITKKTKMIGVCNPHNPLGRVLRKQELECIGALAIEHDLWIMSDEIWSDIVYSPSTYFSMASLSKQIAKRTFTVYGFSKSFGLAGLRIGFLHSPSAKINARILDLSEMKTTAYGATTISQIAAQAAWESAWPYFDEFLLHLKQNRDYAVTRLNAIDGVQCHSPEGTYLLFPNIEAYGKSSEKMANYLLKKGKVAVVPGAAQWFGPGAEGHIRICFATSKGILKEGLDRIEQALEKM